jgi:ubiquinone/menaquinone biosynthesis C-methylase UbiE
MYDKYASVYDQSKQDRLSKRMVPYIRELWAKFGLSPQSLLDLACGTGSAAIAFARQGIQVIGVDLSDEMLVQARKKRQARLVEWQQGDMRSFELSKSVDAAICLFDSLNYLLSYKEFESTLAQVARHLKPGGLFIFDLVSEYALAQEWGNSTEVLPGEALYQIWNSRYDPARHTAEMNLTIFQREGEHYQKIEETHHHRAFDRAEVDQALMKCGFQLLGTYHCLTQDPPSEETYRLAFVARRRAIQAPPKGL